ncbi:MAG: 1,6-anhydro-N-acetylmuramyl-L-alanine amidase AmpD [Oxalobacteraceae bacterium]
MNPTEVPLVIAQDGWCSALLRSACSNFDARPENAEISLLVIHNISLPPGEFGGGYVEALFANALDCDAHPYFDQLRDLRVSSHFLIRRDGSAVQFVSTLDRAWHAGASEFQGRQRCNDFSIGIELEGSDHEIFCDAQYTMLATLTRSLMRRHPLTDVAGHEHIAPDRKTDPGPCFDWGRFHTEFSALSVSELSRAKFPRRLRFPD